MSRRRAVAARMETLDDIHGIMGGMKNLAFAETRKLRRFLATQGRVVREVEAAAGEVLRFHPAPPPPPGLRPVWVVLGSERGFCGDFNEALVRELRVRMEEAANGRIVAVGYRLHTRMENADLAAGAPVLLAGPGVADEVAGALPPLVETLRDLERGAGPLAVRVLFHDADLGRVRARPLLPPFDPPPPAPRRRSAAPPLLHLAPETLLAALVEHHVFAALHEVFLTSLLAENTARVQHLDGAIRRLEEKRRELTLKANLLRQEEITQEIEMILLHVEARPAA
jgi:F-type H+-transporting ATPase subunit gamma